jgi:hypothetical protein
MRSIPTTCSRAGVATATRLPAAALRLRATLSVRRAGRATPRRQRLAARAQRRDGAEAGRVERVVDDSIPTTVEVEVMPPGAAPPFVTAPWARYAINVLWCVHRGIACGVRIGVHVAC